MPAVTEQPLEHELDPDLQEQLLKFPGKWAVVTRSEIIAVGDTLADAMKEAARRGALEGVILHHVPDDSDALNFF